MPFVAHGAPPDYAPKAFCCLKVGGKWKLHHNENGEWKRVYTGLPEDATECSPTAELVGGRWRISFIAGGHESDRRFYLYKIDGILRAHGMDIPVNENKPLEKMSIEELATFKEQIEDMIAERELSAQEQPKAEDEKPAKKAKRRRTRKAKTTEEKPAETAQA